MKIKDVDRTIITTVYHIVNEVKTTLPNGFKFVPCSKSPLSLVKIETNRTLSDERVEHVWKFVCSSKFTKRSYLSCNVGVGGLIADVVVIYDTNHEHEVNKLVKHARNMCTDEN